MADLVFHYYLPLPGVPRARVLTDYRQSHACLELDGRAVLRADNEEALQQGVTTVLPNGQTLRLQLRSRVPPDITVHVDAAPAWREDRLRASTSRSAWIHAFQALAGSFAGFVASWLYLAKAGLLHDSWALKMGQHTAGWHLLLTFTLFPASVLGQRLGIRAVQFVSLVFFLIHAGMALANMGHADVPSPYDPWIATFNAVSGIFFAIATLYGQRAWRDMDPVQALRKRMQTR